MTTTASQQIPWSSFSVILLGAFLGPFGSIVVAVALPTIARDMQSDIQSVKWVVMIYLLVTTFLLPVIGRLSRQLSEERAYNYGMLIAGLGTLLCGLTPEGNLGFLIAARALSAIGTASVFALFSALVTRYVPEQKRGLGFGMVGATVAVALVAGVLTGSTLAHTIGWRWVFWIQSPLQIAGFVLGSLFLMKTRLSPIRNFPWLNAFSWLVVTAGLILVLDAYAKGLLIEWLPLTIPLTISGVVLFVLLERGRNSLIDYSIFANPGFSLGALGILLINLVTFIVTLFVPFYLEDYLGLTAAQMGRYLVIIPIATLIMSPLAGRYSDKRGARLPVLAGLVMTILGFAQLAAIGFSGKVSDIVVGLLLLGIGGGLYNSPVMSLMMGSVHEAQRGIASGLGSLSRNIGFMLGASLGSVSLSLLLLQYGGRDLMLISQQAGLTPENVSFEAFQFALRGMMVLGCVICTIGMVFMARLPNRPELGEKSATADS